MRRLASIVVLVIAAVGIGLQYFGDDLRGLLDVGGSSDESSNSGTDDDDKSPPLESNDISSSGDAPSQMNTSEVVPEVAPASTEPNDEGDRSQIQAFVERRYLMPELPPFADLVGDWSRLPLTMLPTRIQLSQSLELTEKTPAGVVARAWVAEGGSVHPVSSDGKRIAVESLARRELAAFLPEAQTNLRERVEQRYQQALIAARKRVEAQREEDFEWLIKHKSLSRRILREGKLWHDATEARFANVIRSVEGGRAGPVLPEDVGALFWRGPEYVGRDGFSGQFSVILVRFDHDDAGFGRLPYFSKCLLTGKAVVGWLDPVPPRE